MSFDKERYYSKGQPPKDYHYKFCQDGWVLERDTELPIVHSNYNAKVGIISGLLIVAAVVAAVLHVI